MFIRYVVHTFEFASSYLRQKEWSFLIIILLNFFKGMRSSKWPWLNSNSHCLLLWMIFIGTRTLWLLQMHNVNQVRFLLHTQSLCHYVFYLRLHLPLFRISQVYSNCWATMDEMVWSCYRMSTLTEGFGTKSTQFVTSCRPADTVKKTFRCRAEGTCCCRKRKALTSKFNNFTLLFTYLFCVFITVACYRKHN